jgi:hypothetical protein
VAVKLAGMFTAHVHDNWFENNAGESQVELLHDSTNQIGNYVVNSHDNWWNLNGKATGRRTSPAAPATSNLPTRAARAGAASRSRPSP